MKKIIFIILGLFGVAYGQTIGYLRYDSVKMAKNGGNTELILENATKSVTGGVLTNMGNGRTAFVAGGGVIVSDSAWSLTGNASTVAGTNFIGTTDAVGLMFKVNNVQAGYINTALNNTSFGNSSLLANTTGSQNVAIGENSLISNQDGLFNVGVGRGSLYNNVSGIGNTSVGSSSSYQVTGNYNTSVGFGTLQTLASGSNNISIGAYAGKYFTGHSNRLFIGSLDHSTIAGDSTEMIIYGYQDATAANQRLYLNSQVYLPYVPVGVGTQALRIGSDNKVYRADTTAGGTISGLTTNTIPKATSATTIGNSNIIDDGSTVTSAVKVVATSFKDSSTSYVPGLMYNYRGDIQKAAVLSTSSATAGFWGYKNITSGSWSGGTATLGMATANNYAVGNIVLIRDVVPSGYNGTYIITALPTSTSFSYALTSNPGAWSSGGYSTIEPQAQITAYQLGTPAMVISANPLSVPSGIDAYPPVFAIVGDDNNPTNKSWSVGVDAHTQLTYFGGILKSFLNGAVTNGTSEHTYGWSNSTSANPGTAGNIDLNLSRVRANWAGIGTSNNSADSSGNLTLTKLSAKTNVSTPLIITASGSLNLTPASGETTLGSSFTGLMKAADWYGYNAGSNKSYVGGAGVFAGASGGYFALSSSATSPFSQDIYLNRQGVGIFGVGTSTTNASGTIKAARALSSQGADVASTAGAMTLGTDGTSFEITGTNTVTLLSNVGWANGNEVTLMFTGAATLTHGTTTSGTNITMILAGAANFVASADDTITLVLSEIGGTQAWREVSRSVN